MVLHCRAALVIFLAAVLGILPIGCTVPKSPGLLVEYHRSGGFTNVDDRIIVYRDGRTSLDRKLDHREFILDSNVLSQLGVLLSNADFQKLRDKYLPPKPGPDMIEHFISYQGKEVRMVDTAVPLSLQPLLELMSHIIDGDGGSS